MYYIYDLYISNGGQKMKQKESRKPHCITLNQEAERQLIEGAERAHLPKNLYIEKLLREEELRHAKIALKE